MKNRNNRLRQLMLTTALSGLALFGYGRNAYAGGCSAGPDTFTCYGVANSGTDTTITLSGTPLSVSLDALFGHDTSVNGGDAFTLTGVGGLSFSAATAPISITGYSDGIDAYNSGYGYAGNNLTITTTGGSVTGNNGDGIFAQNNGYSWFDSSLSVTTAAVTGGLSGIFAFNDGYARVGDSNLTIDSSAGAVTGTAYYGIDALSRSYSLFGATNLSVTTADVTGGTDGVLARNYGEGDDGSNLTINTTGGTVTGNDGVGVGALNWGDADYGNSSISITTADVTGSTDGIRAYNFGIAYYSSSDLTIDSSAGTVTGTYGNGILALNDRYLGYSGTSNLSVTTGAVTGGTNGVVALNYSAGYDGSNLTINTTGGTVTGNDGVGVGAINAGFAGYGNSSLSITTADVTGATDGIWAVNDGTAYYSSSDLTVNSSAGTVTGTTGNGIYALNSGSGGFGYYSYDNYSTSNLSVTTAGVTGGTNGIWAINEGAGYYGSDLTINSSAGTVTGTAGTGIFALNDRYLGFYGTSNLSVTTGAVTGGTYGVVAINYSDGYDGSNLTIDTTGGTVTGNDGVGVGALNRSFAGYGNSSLSITTADVTGATDGIRALNDGTANYSSSDLTIDSTLGTVTGTDGYGIYAFNTSYAYDGTSNLSVTTAGVTGGTDGIVAVNYGTAFYSSDLTIDSTAGTVTGGTGDGIYAYNYGDSFDGTSNLSVTTADVTGGTNGIWAVNRIDTYGYYGSNLTIDSTAGTVTGTASEGIHAINNGTAGSGTSNLSVTTADVTGGTFGIWARNAGTGNDGSSLTIDTTAGTVTGTASEGIRAYNYGVSVGGYTNLSVTTADVTGGTRGIYAINDGYSNWGSNLTIDSTAGTVTGTASDGIRARNTGFAWYGTTNLSVTTAAATGGTNGIWAVNYGIGPYGSNLTIDSTLGAVTGTDGYGIHAVNNGTAGSGTANLSVTTADVTGGTFGIWARNAGTGSTGSSLTIDTTTGTVTGTANEGIRAYNYGVSGDGYTNLSVTTADVTGGTRGIYAINDGNSYWGSNLTIDSTAGTVTGTASDGVRARNTGFASNGTANLSVTTAGVTGGTNGIWAYNNGIGYFASSLTVTTSGGTVTGTTGVGIHADNNGDGATDINVADYGYVQGGTSGIYAYHSSANAFTIDIDGYSAVSNISGLSSDLAINAESTGAGVTLTTGSSGTIIGTVDLTDANDTFNNGGHWDTSGGVNDFGGGYDVLNNTSSLTIVVGNGSAGQNTWLNNLDLFANDGRIDFADGYASDTLTLSGDFDGNNGTPGLLQMDVYLDSVAPTADMFVINGDVVGGPSDIELFSVGGDGAMTGWGQDDGIAMVDVSNTGNTAAGDFQISQAVWADLYYYGNIVLGTDSIWRLQSSYLPTIPAYEVLPSALLNMTQLQSYRERRGSRVASVSSQTGGPELWLQIGGGQMERGQEGSITETEFEQTYSELATGVDYEIVEGITAGANLRYVSGSADVTSPHGNSSIDTGGFGVGGTVTWQAGNGTYVDGQARYMFYESDLIGQDTGTDATGFAASVEVGHKIPIAENWSVSPQGQLSYTSVDYDEEDGPFGETANLSNGESVIARAGASLDREWAGSGGAHNSLYGTLSVSYDFQPETAVDVSSVTSMKFERAADPTRVELGVGGTFGLSETISLYGTVTASQGVDDFGDSGDLGANVGVSFKW